MTLLPGHDYFLRYKISLCVNLIFTIFAIEYRMKCTREQEEIIFDIRLISDSRKAILRNQSFKLSFNKYSLVHTFRINSRLIYCDFEKVKAILVIIMLGGPEMISIAPLKTWRDVKCFISNLEFSDLLLGTCNHYSYKL